MEELLQLPHGDNETVLVEPMEFDGQLVDALQYLVRGVEKALPLRAFDVHLHDKVFARVTILADLVFECVEWPSILDPAAVPDALFMKDRFPR